MKTFASCTLARPQERLRECTGSDLGTEGQGLRLIDPTFRRTNGPMLRRDAMRSEEHTSELQSLMRISYAVFCLKKKKTNKNQEYITEYIRLCSIRPVSHNTKKKK